MRIVKLQIDDKQATFGQNTLFHSGKNSSGKTTFIRLILFALGFTIPSTKGLDFTKLVTRIELVDDVKKIVLVREGVNVSLYEGDETVREYNVQYERHELLSHFTGVTNEALLDSLLGTFYFDQEKGWTLLNRGDTIGRNHFSVEKFIQGLLDIDESELRDRLTQIETDLRGYRLLEKNIQFKNDIADNQDDIDWTLVDGLNDDLRAIALQKGVFKNEINRLSEAKRSNQKLLDMIDGFGLQVNHKGEVFYLRKDEIVGVEENNGLINARITMLNRQLSDLLAREAETKKRLNLQTALFDVTTQLDRFKNSVANLNVDEATIKGIIKSLMQSRKKIKEKMRTTLRDNGEVNKLYSLIIRYTSFLGVDAYVDQTKDFVFTDNLKAYSGAVLHLLVFSFRLSYLKLMQEKTGIVLPIILDSPFGKEVTKENVTLMYKLIAQEFPENQVITASIEDIEDITMVDKKYFFKDTMFKSLDDTTK
ncbi:hypothetical protein [Weissella sp. MSCH1]|uniref:hypothetical protein n=1 Tax=Weissella sp. MSCH1 TaxID=3383343 RepID=UPI003896CB84